MPGKEKKVPDEEQRKGIEFVRVESVDVHGLLRGMMCDIDYYEGSSHKGVPFYGGAFSNTFDGSLVAGTSVAESVGHRNYFMYPDNDTWCRLPWKKNVASVYVDNRIKPSDPKSDHLMVCPRTLCKLQLEKLAEADLSFYGAWEYEFYTLKEDVFEPIAPTSNFATMQGGLKSEELIFDTIRAMRAMGIYPEAYHSEYGHGQNEITMKPKFGIECPDSASRFRQAVKEISIQKGMRSTFMSKPFLNDLGSSGHFNHSIWDKAEKKNMMYDATTSNKLSQLAEHWIAGLRAHTNEFAALMLPTTNCYARNVPGTYAPLNNSWGMHNRDAAYRAKSFDEPQTYIENRVPGAGCNAYLVTAGVIIAGLDGIKRKLKLDSGEVKYGQEPVGVELLPATLEEALVKLEGSELFKAELGEEFIKAFVALKRDEIARESKAENKEEWYQNFYAEFL